MVDCTNPPKMIALGNKVLVLPQKKQEKSVGGIIIPITANINLEEGEVVLYGDQVIHLCTCNRVLYPATVGIPHEIDGVTFKFLNGPTSDNPGDILAII